MNPTLLVDIALITYNQEEFVRQAIESVLMQQTDFQYRLIIGDDCSIDNTRSIVKDYAERYPDRIETVLDTEHKGLMHKDRVGIRVLKHCTTKYVAMLDGDDYWTDPYKLQKQVDFLEANLDCVICHHNVIIRDEASKKQETCNDFNRNTIYTINELLRENMLATCSVMFRNGVVGEFPGWYFDSPLGDYPLYILNAQYGNIGYLNEIMAVYRRHSQGIHGGTPRINNYIAGIQTRLLIGKNLNLLKHPSLRYSLSKLCRNLSSEYEKNGDISRAQRYAWKRFFYSQAGQRKASMKRLFFVYLRHYYRNLSSLLEQ